MEQPLSSSSGSSPSVPPLLSGRRYVLRLTRSHELRVLLPFGLEEASQRQDRYVLVGGNGTRHERTPAVDATTERGATVLLFQRLDPEETYTLHLELPGGSIPLFERLRLPEMAPEPDLAELSCGLMQMPEPPEGLFDGPQDVPLSPMAPSHLQEAIAWHGPGEGDPVA